MNIGMIYSGREEHIAGINRVIFDVVSELLKIDKDNKYFSLQENYLQLPTKENENLFPIKMLKTYADVYCFLNKIDIIHSYYGSFADYKYNCRKILTIHDVIPLIHPEWFREQSFPHYDVGIRRSVQLADRIIAVSESTKNDIINCYGVSDEKIQVIYPGVHSELNYGSTKGKVLEKYSLYSGYILSVCTLEPRKNLRGLINGYIKFKKLYPTSQLKLVLTGKTGWDNTFQDYINSLGNIGRDIVLTGYVKDEELADLYVHAHAIAYVSFYEGFGLPILEAMAAGKAVITSNTSSMPEVGGDAVVYCNPYEEDSITNAIERIVTNKILKQELEQKALQQSKKFSYNKMAKEILQLYKSLV